MNTTSTPQKTLSDILDEIEHSANDCNRDLSRGGHNAVLISKVPKLVKALQYAHLVFRHANDEEAISNLTQLLTEPADSKQEVPDGKAAGADQVNQESKAHDLFRRTGEHEEHDPPSPAPPALEAKFLEELNQTYPQCPECKGTQFHHSRCRTRPPLAAPPALSVARRPWTVRKVHTREPAYWAIIIDGNDFTDVTTGPWLFPERVAKGLADAHNASVAQEETEDEDLGIKEP